MSSDFPVSLRIALVYSAPEPAPPGRAPSVAKLLALAVERQLLGDPNRPADSDRPTGELTEVVPLPGVEGRAFSSPPNAPSPSSEWLDEALHTLVLVFVDEALVDDAQLLAWLDECAQEPGVREERHRLLPIVLSEQAGADWTARESALAEIQTAHLAAFGERAERTDQIALRLLYEGIRLVRRGLGGPRDERLVLFISHAKRDGVHLALSLRGLVERIGWLQSFYDARSLEAGRSWKRQLQESADASVLLAVRTDSYDGRFWCQAEVAWAEENARPLVVLDARSGLIHAASGLPLESAPTVRIPDGNLLRVLGLTLRVALASAVFLRRIEHLRRQVPAIGAASVFPIPTGPTLAAIRRASEELKSRPQPRFLCYPEPKMPVILEPLASALAAPASAELVTPLELRARFP